MIKYRVYAVSDDPYCCSLLTFYADKAELRGPNILVIDGVIIRNEDGFRELREIVTE